MKYAFLALSLTCTAAAQVFPVVGVVIDGVSGAPLSRARVTLSPSGAGASQAVVTEGDGRFAFEAPRGKFALTVVYHGFRQPFGQTGPGLGYNVGLFTGADQDTSHLVFRWFASGVISGKVIDEHGEPVENAEVQLIRVSISAGRKTRGTVARVFTNDLGEYRFGDCLAATYYLAVTGEPWYTARSQSLRLRGQAAEEKPQEPARSYAPVYYPNAADPGHAQTLQLNPGGEVAADFRLVTVTGVTLHVHCPIPAGKSALITLIGEGAAGVDANQRQAWLYGNQSDQTIAGVLPGHYIVSVAGRGGYAAAARKEIDLGGVNTTVDLSMADLPSITGKVVFSDPNRKPRRAAYVRLVTESNDRSVESLIDPTGAFSFKTIAIGRMQVRMTGADGFFPAQISAEGATLNGSVIDIASGSKIQLTVVASDEIGTLKGHVMNGDKPLAGVLAVLVSRNDPKDPSDFHGYQTDSDGSFEYPNVPAGNYILFAADQMDLEYMNPAVNRYYLVAGTTVQVAPHTIVNRNISLTIPVSQK